MDHEEKLSNKIETLRRVTYLSDKVKASGECEAVEKSRRRFCKAMSGECDEIIYEKRFPAKLKETAYKSHVTPAAQHGSKVWCQREIEIGILSKAMNAEGKV